MGCASAPAVSTARERSRFATAHACITSASAAGTTVIVLIDGLDIRVVTRQGEVLRKLTLDPTKDYQPRGRPCGTAEGSLRRETVQLNRLRCRDTAFHDVARDHK